MEAFGQVRTFNSAFVALVYVFIRQMLNRGIEDRIVRVERGQQLVARGLDGLHVARCTLTAGSVPGSVDDFLLATQEKATRSPQAHESFCFKVALNELDDYLEAAASG